MAQREIERSVCRHCGRPIEKGLTYGWVYVGTLGRTHCSDDPFDQTGPLHEPESSSS